MRRAQDNPEQEQEQEQNKTERRPQVFMPAEGRKAYMEQMAAAAELREPEEDEDAPAPEEGSEQPLQGRVTGVTQSGEKDGRFDYEHAIKVANRHARDEELAALANLALIRSTMDSGGSRRSLRGGGPSSPFRNMEDRLKDIMSGMDNHSR